MKTRNTENAASKFDTEMTDLLEIFVRGNREHASSAEEDDDFIRKTNEGRGFSGISAILGVVYAAYRKCYLLVVLTVPIYCLFAGLAHILNISAGVAVILAIINLLAWGFIFYPYYHWMIAREERKAARTPDPVEYMKRRGGTSILAVCIVIGIEGALFLITLYAAV